MNDDEERNGGQAESMVASYRYLGYAIRAYMLGSNECDVSYQYHIWILVNPRLSMNEAWMDECAARLQPLADHYRKNPTTPNFHNRKIPRFDCNNPIMSWGQKYLF